jgi:hypothetical protein
MMKTSNYKTIKKAEGRGADLSNGASLGDVPRPGADEEEIEMKTRVTVYKADFKELDMDGNPLGAFEKLCEDMGMEATEDVTEIEFLVDTNDVDVN